MNFAVGAIFKNEDTYILEWLAYHKVVGFKHFLIADNASSDMTGRILRILSEHEPITLIDYPDSPGIRPQLGAYIALGERCPDEIDAVAFIDSDEFIVPSDGAPSVVPLLEHLFPNLNVGAVALNWACFGSSGEIFQEDGLVLERFTRRAPQSFSVNQHYKAVVRTKKVVNWASPHHAKLSDGAYVDCAGNEIVYRQGFNNSLSSAANWTGLRINHYAVKSLEEFLTRKSPKGSASKEGRVKHRRYFELHDKNDVECSEILRFGPAVKSQIDEWNLIIRSALEEQPNQVVEPVWRQWMATLKSSIQRE